MSTGDLASEIKLGRAGAELILGVTQGAIVAPEFGFSNDRWEVESRNVVGERFTRVLRRRDCTWNLDIQHATDEARDALLSMCEVADSALSFVFADDWVVHSEKYAVYDTNTGIYLSSSPQLLLDKRYSDLSLTAQVSNFKAFTTYSSWGLQTTTNYYDTATSFNRQTWYLPFNATLTTGDSVYVNYTTKGALVKLSGAPTVRQANTFDGSARRWEIRLKLRGV